MYNRYIPSGAAYKRIQEEDAPPFQAPGPGRQHQEGAAHHQEGAARRQENGGDRRPPPPPPRGDASPLEGIVSWLGGLLKNIHLEDIDSGDILLVLILLFLFLESDDNLELVITLGLLLLFGLFGKDKGEAGPGS